jgi:hypothetical protein
LNLKVISVEATVKYLHLFRKELGTFEETGSRGAMEY